MSVGKDLMIYQANTLSSGDDDDDEEERDFVDDPAAIDFGFDWVNFPSLTTE